MEKQKKRSVVITGAQWGTVFANINQRKSTLRDEAARLGMTEEELIQKGDSKFKESKQKWESLKRTSKRREKKRCC